VRRNRLLTALLGGACSAFLAFLVTGAIADAQPPVPHPLEGREQCLLCHQLGGPGVGIPGGAGLPAAHQGFGEGLCLTCHRSGVGLLLPTPTLAPTPTPTPIVMLPPTGGGSAGRAGWPISYLLSAGGLLLASGVALGLHRLRRRFSRNKV